LWSGGRELVVKNLGSTGAMTGDSNEKCQWHKSWHVTSECCAADLFFRAACGTTSLLVCWVAVRRLVTSEKGATRKRPRRNQAEDNRSVAIPPPSVALASDLVRPDSAIWLGDPNRQDKEGSVEELALVVCLGEFPENIYRTFCTTTCTFAVSPPLFSRPCFPVVLTYSYVSTLFHVADEEIYLKV
jgi:hypothetical protein